jgi:hypothetical protein
LSLQRLRGKRFFVGFLGFPGLTKLRMPKSRKRKRTEP